MPAITITKQNFQKEVLDSNKPVLLDFWAQWCGHCTAVAPVIDDIARERSDIKVGKINVDNEKELAADYHVMSIPTLVVIKNGSVVNQVTGAKTKAQITALLQ